MNIPRYWSKATATEAGQDGKEAHFSCWRGSNGSPEEARELAAQDARNILKRFLQGEKLDRYAYCDAPLREEILEEFHGDDGSPMAMLTRNAYGAVVLNTARIMFIDVDFPPPSVGKTFSALLRLLFRRSGPSHQEEEAIKTLRKVEELLTDKPDFGFRVYRTCAGMRLLATHNLYDPADPATMLLFELLDADPLYIKLCHAQQSFRARLTPKPWRCYCEVAKIRYPREDARQEELFNQWKDSYETTSAGYATCRFQGAMGNEAVHPDVEKFILLHDEMTRAHESLELA